MRKERQRESVGGTLFKLPSTLWATCQKKSGYLPLPCLASVMLPWCLSDKESACQFRRVQSLGGEDPLEKEMATHSSILAWKLPWTEEPGRLQSMGSQNCQTRLSN